ncbi:MAG: sulfur carrier protein ThiS [Candidatus Omnitrophica bacterium]|nr:sulfur carrier protein ThiS [Candidatus Omnitrophota bacterium]
MNITLNGKSREFSDSITVAAMLAELQLHPQQVAVEVNREIVKRDQFEIHQVNDGDEIEILRFVGGGGKEDNNDR